jgi:hypothetical protein
MNFILIGLISICGNFMPNGMATSLNEEVIAFDIYTF